MTVSIQPLACGSLTAGRSMFEAGASDDPLEIPIPAWLIRHPNGLVLFDCGMHADLAADTKLRQKISRSFGVDMTEQNMVTTQLVERDVDPAAIDIVVLSHLHFDHTGGLAQLPNARVVIQAAEWQAGLDDDLSAANSFRRADYDLGHDIVRIEGEHDLLGDGRVACVPTPGHTPGHQSMRIRLDSGDLVLCADCAYFAETLIDGALPPFGHDTEQQAKSVESLRAMGRAGATLIPGHDPATIAALAPTMI